MLYKELMAVPSVDAAVFVKTDQQTCTVSMVMSQTDLQNKKDKYYYTSRSVVDKNTVTSAPFPIELSSPIVSVSPSGNKQVVVRELGENEYGFDINYIAYIADKKTDTTSFFDKEPKEKIVGDQYLYRNDWGETYPTIASPSIFVVDIVNEAILPVPWAANENLTAGQAIWTPNEATGLIVNFKDLLKQRADIKAKQPTLAAGEKAAVAIVKPVNLLGDTIGCFRSPRFTPCASKIVFFGIPGHVLPHNTCSQLLSIDWTQGKPTTKIDTLIGEKNFADSFTGIYGQSLPTNPWINQDTLVFSTAIKSKNVVFSFNIKNKELNMIQDINASCDVLDFVATVKSKDGLVNQENLELQSIYETTVNQKVKELLANIDWKIEDVPVAEPKIGNVDTFQIIHAQPKSLATAPLLLFPHGGPHVSSGCDYIMSVALLCSLGYAVTQINYRGSTGFGKDSLDILPGRIGVVDLNDCIAALDYLLATRGGSLDKDRVGVIGGSHGGFLAGHFIGLKDPRVKVAVMRNPLSDIPDWCFFEAGVELADGATVYPVVPDLQQIEKMRNCSPMAHLDNMKAPTLLAIGDSDLRVPPSQGMLLYNSLLQRGVATKQVMDWLRLRPRLINGSTYRVG
eukprot:gene12852-15094_t